MSQNREIDLSIYIGMAKDKAKLEAKHLKSYIITKNKKGQIIKEYYNGKIEVITEEEINEYIKNS